ncbi:hypothetical protein ASC84_12280 [Acinetobacter sp. Root1280]|nr:phage antirepressor N-terminal domain-containing protein [Acinetobacter sp. Root1280]KQW88150.1 hypothetical protein ASC84_12280 [Acinetobacter sp. Root1280]
MHTLAQINAPFNGVELIIIEHNQQPYTPMRPIVEGMGLAWQAQFDKLKQRFNSVIMEIMTTGKDGKSYKMICLPLRKLFGWLMTISPNKVKPELRDTVIKYQEECDDVLWDYWTKGITVNPRSTKEEREPLTNAVNLLVAKTKHLNYSDAYKLVHQRFNVKHIDEIPYDTIPVAVEYVHHLIALYSQANKHKDTEPHIQAVLQDQNVQFLMWYVPILAKFVKNELYPALTVIQSSYAGRLIGLTQEVSCHANILNRKAIGYGITLKHVGDKQPHSMEWYLA